MADDYLPAFRRGVFDIVENAGQWITEDGARFVKGDFVLLAALALSHSNSIHPFLFESHGSSLALDGVV
jgi:hypothetical protein